MDIRSLLLFISIFVSSTIYSQNIDSLLQLYPYTSNQVDKYEIDIQLARAHAKNNQLDSAEYYGLKALKIAQKFETGRFKGKTFALLGNIFFDQRQLSKADSFYIQASEYITDRDELLDIYNNRYAIELRKGDVTNGEQYLKKIRELIGTDTNSVHMLNYHLSYSTFHGEQHEILKQLQSLLKAKEIAKNQNRSLLTINYNLSIVYEAIKAYDQALAMYTENRKAAQEANNPRNELYSLYGICSITSQLKDYEATKKAAYKAIALREKYDVSSAFGYNYYCLGFAHLKQGQLDSAEYYFNKGIEISLLQEEKKELGDNYMGMSELMLVKGNKKLTKFYAEKAKAILSYVDVDMNSKLAKFYADEKNYEKAYASLRENWDNWEKTEADQTKIITTLLEDKYQQEKQLKDELFQQELAQQRRSIVAMILFIGLILVSVFAFIQIRNNRKLKALNKALNQRNEALKHFTYITSHDLKEPVRNIKSFSGLLQRKLKNKPQTQDEKDYLDFISNSTDTLYEIIQSLKVFTDVSFGETLREEVNLNTVIENVKNNLNETIRETNTQINIDNSENITSISFSKTMLTLILQNLIQNGIKYNNSDQPIINISITKQDNKTLFKISDNGIGIKAEFFEKIFQPFKTLTNKSISKSSGLGLAICKNIIENYDGKIWVESDGKTGSQFYFVV